jgi:hypothetical protein
VPISPQGVVPAAADCVLGVICTSPTPTTSPRTTPPASPKVTPKVTPSKGPGGGGGSGGGSTYIPPNSSGSSGGGVIAPSDLVGQGPGPATPPNVSAASIDIASDPSTPGPGDTATLTVTASGNRGLDRYGVKDVKIELKVSESPASDARVEPASVTTDSSGTATAKFTTSKTKGRNVVTATAGSVASDFNVDTLIGSTGALTRGRHGGNLDPTPAGTRLSPLLLFGAAGVLVAAGFLFPYRHRLLAVFRKPPRGGPPAPRRRQPVASSSGGRSLDRGWKASSTRKSRARPKSTAPGG